MRRLVLAAVVLASGVVAGTVLLLGRDGLKVAVAGSALVASGLLLWLWRRQAAKSAVETQPSHHDRTQMLNRAQQHWIKEGLDNSLKNQTRIALGLTHQEDEVLQLRMELRQLGREPEPLPAGATISRIFDRFSGGLLILGPLGSGKTTTLLELTRDLLNRAGQDAEQPIPVVFNLSSWAQQPFDDWLVEELHHSYEVPRKIAKSWVNRDHILPLLDGLDELPSESRDECVTAIQQFLSEHPVNLVMCGHTDEYQTLATRLGLENGLVLQPLTRQQVYDYLETVGLSQAREALQANDRLWELVGSPLMLNIVALAYQGKTPHALRMDGTLAQRRRRLFADYTERMFARRPLTSRHYTKDQAKHWLTRLARAMRAHRQSEFDLDRMQPDWLPTAAQRRLVTLAPAIVSGLVGGLLVGLAARLGVGLAARLGIGPGVGPGIELAKGPGVEVLAGLVFTLVAVGGGRGYEPVGRFGWPWSGLGVGLGVGMVAGLVGGAVVGLVFGLVAMGVGLVYELVHGDRMRGIRWSWPRLVAGLAVGAMVGLVGGVIGGVVAGLVVGLMAMGVGLVYELVRGDGMEGAGATINPVEELRWSQPRLGLGLGVGLLSGLGSGFLTVLARWLHGGFDVLREVVLNYGLGSGTVIAIAVVLVFVLGSGLGSGLASETITPNEGIHRSMRRGVVVGLLGLLGVVVVSVLVSTPVYALRFTELGVELTAGLSVGLANGLINGSVLGLVFGLAVGLEFGGIALLRHVTLRGLLVRNRFAPWRYVAFLDDAAERLFLHRSGGSYVFRHPLLLDSFADLEAEPSANHRK